MDGVTHPDDEATRIQQRSSAELHRACECSWTPTEIRWTMIETSVADQGRVVIRLCDVIVHVEAAAES
jgi:hypothetical protein